MRTFIAIWACLAWTYRARRLFNESLNEKLFYDLKDEPSSDHVSMSKVRSTLSPIQVRNLKETNALSRLLFSRVPRHLAGPVHRLTDYTRPRLPVSHHASPQMKWEETRSGKIDVFSIEQGLQGHHNGTQRFPLLHQREYNILRRLQRVPGLLRFSLAVHYSLLPKVITPLLALIVWLVSLPRGASLITFVCASDCVNTALKWAVQRPRPRWYCPIEANSLIKGVGAWEVDLSFPSAHTMFFAGLAACASTMYGFPLWPAATFGTIIGFSRNYLSMHWPTDTSMGLALGCILGSVWGVADPYAQLVAAKSPVLSIFVATLFTSGLVSLMVASRNLIPPVSAAQRSAWFANALHSLSAEERNATLADHGKHISGRSIRSKIPMIVTVWAALAMTGLYPVAMPDAINEPVGSMTRRLSQTIIGVSGLGGVDALKKTVGKRKFGKNVAQTKSVLKALTYLAICAWTFLGSQIIGNKILDGLGMF